MMIPRSTHHNIQRTTEYKTQLCLCGIHPKIEKYMSYVQRKEKKTSKSPNSWANV